MLTLDSQGSVVFDEELKTDFDVPTIKAWLSLDEHDENYPLAIIQHMPWSYRKALAEFCSSNVEVADQFQSWQRWCPGFTFPDHKWDLDRLKICHAEKANTWAIDNFYVTESGIRLFSLHDGSVVSDKEFMFVFGQTMVEHFNEHAEAVASHMSNLAEQYLSEIVTKEIMVTDGNSVYPITISCLKASNQSHWCEQLDGLKLLEILETP